MEFRHLFVCVNQRPPGHPMGSCTDKGGREIYSKLMEKIQMDPELFMSTVVTPTGCLGPCGMGATLVVYPEGVWYGNVKPSDVEDIVQSHLKGGQPVERLVVSRGKPPGMF
ncbi:MAG: ferredoxin [Aquificaceae bacterium]|nr:ferredoxin [Aquificaceae bacterium]MCX8060401.1 ferredoxin [Aquificaceae bacterium]MDW8096798.1 (2Fe-2S) ferredoxin domain-containing protein [Aquificaceae bacterium]